MVAAWATCDAPLAAIALELSDTKRSDASDSDGDARRRVDAGATARSVAAGSTDTRAAGRRPFLARFGFWSGAPAAAAFLVRRGGWLAEWQEGGTRSSDNGGASHARSLRAEDIVVAPPSGSGCCAAAASVQSGGMPEEVDRATYGRVWYAGLGLGLDGGDPDGAFAA